ncbi:hypothetical protein [Acidisoma sp. 7E03]
MRRLSTLVALLCVSLLLYGALFALILDRPLDLGPLRRAWAEKIAAAEAVHGPKLVIFAGSNALFSHRCAVIGPMLDLPCINAGVASGLGLDLQFALWLPHLDAGDTVYIPLELQQYVTSATASRAGPDAAILWRHDRTWLWRLGLRRSLAAAFSGTLPDAVASLVEMAAAALRPALAHPAFTTMNAVGDGIGHDLAEAAANRAFLAHLHRADPSPGAIAAGDGAEQLRAFRERAAGQGVRVIGGWPTEFADAPPASTLGRTLAALYGGDFLALPNQGRYPRADFFDSQDHLAEECQVRHSIAVALGLAVRLGRPVLSPSAAMVSLASRCP